MRAMRLGCNLDLWLCRCFSGNSFAAGTRLDRGATPTLGLDAGGGASPAWAWLLYRCAAGAPRLEASGGSPPAGSRSHKIFAETVGVDVHIPMLVRRFVIRTSGDLRTRLCRRIHLGATSHL